MKYRLPLDPPSLGQRIVEHMTRVKLDMLRFKDDDGDSHLWCDYEVHGTIRLCSDEGDGLATVQELMQQMLLGKPPESLDLGDDEDEAERGAT